MAAGTVPGAPEKLRSAAGGRAGAGGTAPGPPGKLASAAGERSGAGGTTGPSAALNAGPCRRAGTAVSTARAFRSPGDVAVTVTGPGVRPACTTARARPPKAVRAGVLY